MESQATMEPQGTNEGAATAAPPPSLAQATTAIVPVEDSESAVPVLPEAPVQMIAVRRRSRRRRRSRADRSETPERRRYVVLLCVVAVLMAIAAVKPIRESLNAWLHGVAPAMERHGIGLEVVALVIAGLILLYLMPGMEERLLRLIGINRTKRR